MARDNFRPRRIAFAGSARKLSARNVTFCQALGAWFAAKTRDVLIAAGYRKAPNSDDFL